MKKLVLTALVAAAVMTACSKDDEPVSTVECNSCTYNEQKAEICDNGDGTYTYTYAGIEDTITQEEIENTGFGGPKGYIEFLCDVGGF